MTQQTNPQLQLAFDFIQSTSENLFLTGKAGTGKTTFLHHLKEKLPKRMIVVAPTGVAAINAGGVTIHSFFQLPFGPILPAGNTIIQQNSKPVHRFSRTKINIIRSIDLLVIDEISMVRADLLDGIDDVLRRFRRTSRPFGGVQLLMIGDMHQLAPVIKDDEWELLKPFYPTCFFFSSTALRKTSYLPIELKEIFRQSDYEFIELLNDIRNGNPSDATLAQLNARYSPGTSEKDAIILTTHNYQSNAINTTRLGEIKDREYSYEAEIKGDFPEYSFPADRKLVLKKGAKVMFIKNDSSGNKEFYNGKIGTVVDLSEENISVFCNGDDSAIEVPLEKWDNVRYDLDEETKEIKENVIGTFIHFPLKLAWAITIHKSQGLTFDKVVIDASQAFAFGQVYVALSRCRSLEGVILRSPLNRNCIKSDSEIISFTGNIAGNEPSSEALRIAREKFRKQLIEELFGFSFTARILNRIIRIVNENRGSFSKELPGLAEQLSSSFKTEISEVSEKFLKQIENLSIQYGTTENDFVNERIIKAVAYFSEKNETILLKGLRTMPLDTDNKAIRKSVNEEAELLYHELLMKKACLASCAAGFDIQKYMQTKARQNIEEEVRPRYGKEIKPISAIIVKHPEVYEALKKWRGKKAKEQNVTFSRIIKQQALEDISNVLPGNIRELAAIKGIGAKKRKEYGPEILSIIVEYKSKNGFEIPPEGVAGTRYKGNTDVKSDQLSFDMFKSGLKVPEIAEERGFTVSTIEGHLARFVAKGELDVHLLIDDAKLKTICQYFDTVTYYNASTALQALGEGYSYSDIRMALAYYVAGKEKSDTSDAK